MLPANAPTGFRRHHGWLFLLLLFSGGCATPPPVAPLPAELENEVLRIIRANPKLILDTVTQYQTAQAEAEQKAAEKAQRAALESFDINALVAGSPSMGASGEAITLVAFSDFQCPFCAKSLATVRDFMQKHGAEVRLVFKHLPLTDIHPQAESAARAAWAAHRQGKFWPYHDALFTRQRELGEPLYRELAATLKLDVSAFNRDFASPEARQAVQADLGWAQRLGVNATPHFLLGRTAISGALPLESFEKALADEKALR